MIAQLGHNGGPPLDWRTLEEAQADPVVSRRPAYLQRYAGPGAPLQDIVGIGSLGAIGQRVLLRCGHWREIRDWGVMPAMGRKRPTQARCGLCREKILPDEVSLRCAQELAPEEAPGA